MDVDSVMNIDSSVEVDSVIDVNSVMEVNSTMDVDSVKGLYDGMSTSAEEEPQSTTPTMAQSVPPRLNPDRPTLLNMPAEILNQIYAECRSYLVDVLRPHYPALFRVHPNLTRQFADYYYSESVFMLNTRFGPTHHAFDRYLAYLETFQNWSSTLSDRRAGLIQHIRIVTTTFTASVHVPLSLSPDPTATARYITVTFGHLKRECQSCGSRKITEHIDKYHSELQKFNNELSGKELTSRDLDRLVWGILDGVPCSCPKSRC